jgi:hypothetical protein
MAYIIAPTQHSINRDFITYCQKGKIKAAMLLLNSPTTKFYPDERTVNQAVIEAYFLSKIKVMKYLLESAEVSKKPDLNYKKNLLFRSIYADKDYSLLNYLIFDLKIDKTPRIIEELEDNPDSRVSQMFMLRELNTELVTNASEKNKRIKL